MTAGAVPGPRRVLVHVGAPKTGTSFVQDVLFAQPRVPGRAGHPLPRRPVRRALPRRARPDGAALGRPRDAGRRRLGPARRAGPRLAGHRRSSPTRSSPPPAGSRCAARSTSFGDAEVHVVLSARDLVRQIPAEWQENVKHRRNVGYRAFLDKITDPRAPASWRPGSGASRRCPTSSTAGAARCRPSGCTWSPCRSPGADRGPALAAVRRRARPRRGGARRRPPPGRTRRSASPRPRWSAGSTSEVNNGVLANEDYRAVRPRAARAPHAVAALRLPAARPARRRARLGRRPVGEPGSRSSPSGGTTWWARSTSCGPTSVDPPFADPDEPDEADVADAAVQSIVTLLEEVARRERGRAACCAATSARRCAELDRARGLWFRVKRRLVHAADDNRLAAGRAGGLPRVRGSSSRSA